MVAKTEVTGEDEGEFFIFTIPNPSITPQKMG